MDNLLDTLDHLEHVVFVALIVFVCLVLLIKAGIAFYRKFPPGCGLKISTPRRACGIIFGYIFPGLVVYSPCTAESHIGVFGTTGTGKTTAILLPSLISWSKKGSIFCIDISGDICSHIPGDKIVYAPMDDESACYNPFAEIDAIRDQRDKDIAITRLAHLLMPDPAPQCASDASAFFTQEGRKILIAALLSGYHKGLDFTEICKWIVDKSWQELFTEIDKDNYPLARSYINSFFGASEKNTAGCKQSCDAAIELFAHNYHLAESIHRPFYGQKCYTPQCLEYEQAYICIPDNMLEVLAPLLHLITAQTLDYIAVRPLTAKTPILIALDELSSLGHLDLLATLRKARKRHTRLLLLTQDVVDLSLVYGRDERASMLTNIPYKVVLGVGDSDSQDYFARIIGQAEFVRKSYTSPEIGLSGGSCTTSSERRAAVDPASLSQLGKRLILLHPGGYLFLKKAFFYEMRF